MEFQAPGLNADKRVLYGLLTQTGGGAPSVVVIKNTIGAFTTQYLVTGQYTLTFDPRINWPLNLAWQIFMNPGTIPGGGNAPLWFPIQGVSQAPGVLFIVSRNLPGGGFSDGQYTNASLAIILWGRY